MYGVVELPPVSARASVGAVSEPVCGFTSPPPLVPPSVVPGSSEVFGFSGVFGPFGVSQVASARVTSPSTSATLRFSGLTDTLSWSAVAAAVRSVVTVFDRSRETSPTPGTATRVGPPAESVTFLPSTATWPSTFDSATGFLPTSQTALEVTFSTSMSESTGSPGTWILAFARLV